MDVALFSKILVTRVKAFMMRSGHSRPDFAFRLSVAEKPQAAAIRAEVRIR
jgi:hypothetical protein